MILKFCEVSYVQLAFRMSSVIVVELFLTAFYMFIGFKVSQNLGEESLTA